MVAGMEGKGEKRVGYLVEICCIIVAPWWIYGMGVWGFWYGGSMSVYQKKPFPYR